MGLLGSGSDHAAFAFYANIPAIAYHFEADKKKYKGLGFYSTYHTGFETFYLMDKIVDPGFKIHRTCAQVLKILICLRTLDLQTADHVIFSKLFFPKRSQ